jgi:hypothetical protein
MIQIQVMVLHGGQMNIPNMQNGGMVQYGLTENGLTSFKNGMLATMVNAIIGSIGIKEIYVS